MICDDITTPAWHLQLQADVGYEGQESPAFYKKK